MVSLRQESGQKDPAAEAHSLIEEFMLLANRLAAERIAAVLPSRALLRMQSPPRADRVRAWASQCAQHAPDIGIDWMQQQPEDVVAATAKLQEAATSVGETDPTRGAGLNALAALAVRTMSSARYTCGLSEDCGHWSLGIAQYTHFTSPLRRYADLLVHRELSKLILDDGTTDCGKGMQEGMSAAVQTINARAQHAKWAEQDCNEACMARWLEQQGPVVVSGVVVALCRDSATVLVPRFGMKVQCFYDAVASYQRHSLVPETPDNSSHYVEVELVFGNDHANFRELDICCVELTGTLGRRAVVEARLMLPISSADASPESPSSALPLCNKSEELCQQLARLVSSSCIAVGA